jgi:uncharacterized protein YegJ (DUF2314 family)
MARPIPVFAFAFAAYAAASAGERMMPDGEGQEGASAGGDAYNLFLASWRMSLRRGAKMRVKIGVTLGEGAARRARETEELWLDDIVETEHGFSGTAWGAPERLGQVKPGQKVDFAPDDILGWALDVDMMRPSRARPGAER